MPELPEVETVVRYLRPKLLGKKLLRLKIFPNAGTVLPKTTLRSFNSRIRNQKVVSVRRRAKYIVFDLGKGCITVHLRMTGKLFVGKLDKVDKKHIRCAFFLSDNITLLFEDFRKFGKIDYFSNPEELNNSLGVEPLSSVFTVKYLSEILRNRKRQMKPLLLDQKVIAGLGNIYTDEALWAAKIHPQCLSNKVSIKKIEKLRKSIRKVLKAGIKHSGTTFSTFSFEKEELGQYAEKLKVFGRQGEPCPDCGAIIKKIRVAQRGTHICPRCQKKS